MSGINKMGEMPNFQPLENNNNNNNNIIIIAKNDKSSFKSVKKSNFLNKWDFIACTITTVGSAYALTQTNYLPLKLAGLACLSGIAIKVLQLPMINKIIKMRILGNKANQLSSQYWRRGIMLTMISSALIGLAALKYIPNQTMLSKELVGNVVSLVAVQTILELGVFLHQVWNAAKRNTIVY